MEVEAVKKYRNKEVLVITKSGYRYYGIIEAVESDTVYVTTTKKGNVTLTNDVIALIEEIPVRWEEC